MAEFPSGRLTWGDVDALLHGEDGQAARQALYSKGTRGGEGAMAAERLERMLGEQKQVRFNTTRRIDYNPAEHVDDAVEALYRRLSRVLAEHTPAHVETGRLATLAAIMERLGIGSFLKSPIKT